MQTSRITKHPIKIISINPPHISTLKKEKESNPSIRQALKLLQQLSGRRIKHLANIIVISSQKPLTIALEETKIAIPKSALYYYQAIQRTGKIKSHFLLLLIGEPNLIEYIHELTHILDQVVHKKKYSGIIGTMVQEGRASFAEVFALGRKPSRKRFIINIAKAAALPFILLSLEAYLLFSASINPISLCAAIIALIALLTKGKKQIVDLKMRFRYGSFALSMQRIANKVGDAGAAFRMTGKKQPTSIWQILFPLRYYANEIEKTLKRKEKNVPQG